MHVDLEEALAGNPELTIDCHRNCVSTYTSKLHLSRQKKRQSNANDLQANPVKDTADLKYQPLNSKRTACFVETCVNWRKTRSTPVDGKEQYCAVQRMQGLAKKLLNSPS